MPVNLLCGHYIYTLSEEEGEVCGEEWHKIKESSLIVPNDSYAKIKIYILETCKQNNTCQSVQKKIDNLITN